MKSLYIILEKITANGGVIPTETFISLQPKTTESRNWYQMIAMTIFYNHVMIYKQADFLVSQFFKKT